MNKYILTLGIISIFLIAACTQQQPTQVSKQPSLITPASTDKVVAESKPSIAVDEQKVKNDNVIVTRIFLDKPGYVEIHKIENGKPGIVIGNSELLEGEKSDIEVKISDYENENELIAMLHYDDGDGVHEFPGDDKPTTLDGKVVLQKIVLLENVPSQEPIKIETPSIPPIPPIPSVKEFDIVAKKWDFNPSTIRVKEGDIVKLNVESIDVSHGLAIFEFGINERLNPGKTVSIEFTADKAGEYVFLCTVPCGKGHGSMRGTLIVE